MKLQKLSSGMRKLLNDFEAAAIERSWAGARDLDTHGDIADAYRNAKAALVRKLVEMEYALKLQAK